MGKETYLIFDFEESLKTPSAVNWKKKYDPSRWEEIKIDFHIPPSEKHSENSVPERAVTQKAYVEMDRRQSSERRVEKDRRLGSVDRRGWQESRWIGAPDCRDGRTDRRKGKERRKNPDRRQK